MVGLWEYLNVLVIQAELWLKSGQKTLMKSFVERLLVVKGLAQAPQIDTTRYYCLNVCCHCFLLAQVNEKALEMLELEESEDHTGEDFSDKLLHRQLLRGLARPTPEEPWKLLVH